MYPADRWIKGCAYGAFLAALPTALWRIALAAGFTLGTPTEWRAVQDIPGSGTWYLLGLSAVQLAAAACSFAFVVDMRPLVPGRLRRWTPAFIGGAGLIGTALLVLIVTMSVLSWEKVDPFAGHGGNGWAWLCLVCYLCAVLWPVFLAVASTRFLVRHGAGRRAARSV